MDDPFDRELLERVGEMPLIRGLRRELVRYFDATLAHASRIPRSGGALLVGNHGFFGLDGVVLGCLLANELGHPVRFLGERNFFRVRALGSLLHLTGTVEGEPNAAEEMLRRGEIVVVYPGGVDDSFKLTRDRYSLQWGERRGFARVAIRAGVPIVPIAARGIDEMYEVVAKERWLGRRLFGSPRYDIPIALGRFGLPWSIPKPSKQTYVACEPVDTAGAADDEEHVDRVRRETRDRLLEALRPGD